jgi:hypothetical protein
LHKYHWMVDKDWSFKNECWGCSWLAYVLPSLLLNYSELANSPNSLRCQCVPSRLGLFSTRLHLFHQTRLQIFLPPIFNNHVANHEFTSCIHLQQLAWVLNHNKFRTQDIKTYICTFPYTFLHLCKMLHFFIVHIWFVQARSLKIEIIYQDNIEGKLCHLVQSSNHSLPH